MSLESLISERADIRQGFAARLPPVGIRFERGLQVPPATTNSRMVGGAFGYLMRFRVQRLNPRARVSAWRAEAGARRIDAAAAAARGKEVATISPYPRGLRAAAYVADGKRQCEIYLQDGVVTNQLMEAAHRLAHLDLAAEGGPQHIDWRSINYLSSEDAVDLQGLLEIVDDSNFEAARACFVDPALSASALVGGAYPDFIIDQCVIDVNATHEPKFDVRELYRLIGYYLLLGLGGIVDDDGKAEQVAVNSIGMYFPRFGQLWKTHIRDVVHPYSVPEFTRWFVEAACASNEAGLDVLNDLCGPLAAHIRSDATGDQHW